MSPTPRLDRVARLERRITRAVAQRQALRAAGADPFVLERSRLRLARLHRRLGLAYAQRTATA